MFDGEELVALIDFEDVSDASSALRILLLSRLVLARTPTACARAVPRSRLDCQCTDRTDRPAHPARLCVLTVHQMCREVLILDVAMCLVGCCYDREANKLDVDKAQAFLRAYESVSWACLCVSAVLFTPVFAFPVPELATVRGVNCCCVRGP